jgi:hypothetical protein
LEFSVFPLLIATVPYATQNLAEATYHSTPFGIIQRMGECLMLSGVPLVAFSIPRSRVLPSWSAVPFAVTTVLMFARFLPTTAAVARSQSTTFLYLSMTILGVAVFRATVIRNVSHLRM